MYSLQIAQLVGAHIMLAVCALVFLGWRLLSTDVAQKAPESLLRVAKVVCPVLVGVLMVVSIGLFIVALRVIPHAMPTFVVCAVAIIFYVIALAVSYILLSRPITATLPLLACWLGLEANFLNGLVSTRLITGASLIVLFLLVAACTLVSVVCYILYPRVRGKGAVIICAVPCACIAVVSCAFAISMCM